MEEGGYSYIFENDNGHCLFGTDSYEEYRNVENSVDKLKKQAAGSTAFEVVTVVLMWILAFSALSVVCSLDIFYDINYVWGSEGEVIDTIKSANPWIIIPNTLRIGIPTFIIQKPIVHRYVPHIYTVFCFFFNRSKYRMVKTYTQLVSGKYVGAAFRQKLNQLNALSNFLSSKE